MKKLILLILILFTITTGISALPIMYAEHYYKLYHLNLYRYPEDYLQNLYYLELALEAPFANPLNAMARVETEKEHEYYRALFKMHCNLKMTENYRYLGAKFDKRHAYWYNAPFRKINIESLDKAENLFKMAEYYWKEAQLWSDKAAEFEYLVLDELQFWMDESWRIRHGELDYGKYIGRDLARVEKVRAAFEAMDEETFPVYKGEERLARFFRRRSIEEIKRDNDTKPLPPRKTD